MNWLPTLGSILILAGALAVLAGAIGLLRMPDFFTRLHPVGVKDALGLPLILLGAMLHAGLSPLTLKLLLLFLFIMFTSPTACHALARAAVLEKKEGEK